MFSYDGKWRQEPLSLPDPNLSKTTTAMLAALHDPSDAATWAEFDARYRPVLIGFARNLGLADADAADVAQDTLARFLEQYREGKYERERGRLGAWLVGIARYRVLDLRRKHGRRPLRGESAMIDLNDDKGLTEVWEDERRKAILRQSMGRLRSGSRTDEKTIRAFEMLFVHGMTPQAVADELEMTVQGVYVAKSRVAERLQKIVGEIEAEFDEEA